MKLQEIREIAKGHGIKAIGNDKQQMIKQIQIAEGNFDCFATAADGFCDQLDCAWRDDCLKLSLKAAH